MYVRSPKVVFTRKVQFGSRFFSLQVFKILNSICCSILCSFVFLLLVPIGIVSNLLAPGVFQHAIFKFSFALPVTTLQNGRKRCFEVKKCASFVGTVGL
jgi:hypothetical protein